MNDSEKLGSSSVEKKMKLSPTLFPNMDRADGRELLDNFLVAHPGNAENAG
jgi:hypothetical protein